MIFMECKYGKYYLANNGYYTLSSKEHYKKLLHRVIWEEHYGEIPKGYVVHHKDGNKLNNDIENLELMSLKEHGNMHHKGKKLSREHRDNISKARKGMVFSEEHCNNISKAKKGSYHNISYDIEMSKKTNKVGYFRVYKDECKACKQGFIYTYHYNEYVINELGETIKKRRKIRSTSLEKLEKKVKAKELVWCEV